MGCTLSKNNEVTPAGMAPCITRGRFTNFKIWVGKKRCALFKRKVRRNQVMPLNPSPEDCHSISPEPSHGTASCHTPLTPSSSNSSYWTTTLSDLSGPSDVSQTVKIQLADPVTNDQCRTQTIEGGSAFHQSVDDSSESSEESHHGNSESRKRPLVCYSAPPGSPIDNLSYQKTLMKMIMQKSGATVSNKEAEHLLEYVRAKAEEEERLDWDLEDDDFHDDERTVNMDANLRATTTSAQTYSSSSSAATAEALLPPRIRQDRPKAARGERTNPTGRGFEQSESTFQRKY